MPTSKLAVAIVLRVIALQSCVPCMSCLVCSSLLQGGGGWVGGNWVTTLSAVGSAGDTHLHSQPSLSSIPSHPSSPSPPTSALIHSSQLCAVNLLFSIKNHQPARRSLFWCLVIALVGALHPSRQSANLRLQSVTSCQTYLRFIKYSTGLPCPSL